MAAPITRPRRGRVLRPDFVLDAVAHLTAADIAALAPGVTTLCFDIDGTVTDYHSPAVPQAAASHLRALNEAGYQTFVVSNCYGKRAQEVHRLFDDVATGVFTPEDCLAPGETPADARSHGKPAPDMILAAIDRAQVSPGQVLMVGDQLFKDVLAARRAGTSALLVPRLGPSDHTGVRILQRPVEVLLRLATGLPVARRSWPRTLTRVP